MQSFIQAFAEKVGVANEEGGVANGESGVANPDTLKRLIDVSSVLEQGSDQVKDQLDVINPDSLARFIVCLVTPGVGPELEDFQKAQPGNQLKSLWMEADGLSKTAAAFGETLGRFQGALKPANDSKSVWAVLASRGIPGLGFKAKGETAAQAGNISPISKSCGEKLVRLVKALSNHVTALPVDHRGNRTGAGRPPKVVPAIMHTVVKVGKKALGLLQRYGLTGKDGADRAGARTDFVHRQHALVGKEILVAKEEKAGDWISNSMNGEHTRLVLSHFRWMFGNIMAVKYQQLAHILSLYFGQIYSRTQPSPHSRLAC